MSSTNMLTSSIWRQWYRCLYALKCESTVYFYHAVLVNGILSVGCGLKIKFYYYHYISRCTPSRIQQMISLQDILLTSSSIQNQMWFITSIVRGFARTKNPKNPRLLCQIGSRWVGPGLTRNFCVWKIGPKEP